VKGTSIQGERIPAPAAPEPLEAPGKFAVGFTRQKRRPERSRDATSAGRRAIVLSIDRATERVSGRFRRVGVRLPGGAARTRKPRLLLRLPGSLLLQFDAVQLLPLLFQLPPRITREEPPGRYPPDEIYCRSSGFPVGRLSRAVSMAVPTAQESRPTGKLQDRLYNTDRRCRQEQTSPERTNAVNAVARDCSSCSSICPERQAASSRISARR
jgi:hypothetical protein